MKQRLMRPTAALFPIVGIAGALWGNANCTTGIIVFYYLIQLLSLCVVDCFRNSAAQEPGIRRVDRRFSGSAIPLAIGMLFTWLLWRFAISPRWQIDGWQSAYIAAVLVCIEHMFEERMYAFGRRMDGVMLSCIANGLLLMGLLLDRGRETGLYEVTGAGLGALISVCTSYAIEPIHGLSFVPISVGFCVTAMPQTLLYITAAAAATALVGLKAEIAAIPFLFGLIPWRLARTNCRRAQDESPALNLLLILFAALPTAAAAWIPEMQIIAICTNIALICSAAVFCAPSVRLYAGIILTAAAFIPYPSPFISAALALAAILININRAFLRKV